MAAFRELRSMALSDDELHDMAKARAEGPEADLPDYPPGMRFTVRECCFERLGIDEARPGESIGFATLARVTNVNLRTDGCRVELEMMMLKLGDGEFAELDDMARPTICLDENDHDRLDLDEDTAERGDVLHLIGEARVVSVDDNNYVGRSICLQIEEGSLAAEDEDQESEGSADE